MTRNLRARPAGTRTQHFRVEIPAWKSGTACEPRGACEPRRGAHPAHPAPREQGSLLREGGAAGVGWHQNLAPSALSEARPLGTFITKTK